MTKPRRNLRSARRTSAPGSLPGDLSPKRLVERIIRVDQAGEFGAVQIYRGQLAVLAGTDSEPAIREMAEQEREHLATFDRFAVERRVRPTALSPLWRAAGFALGASTALIGERAAMACTVAVEEVIEEHYQRQAEALGDSEPVLRQTIERYREDELHHRDVGLASGAEDTPGYRMLSGSIRAGTRLAIWLSERI